MNKTIILNFYNLKIVFRNVAKIFKKVPSTCYTFQTVFFAVFFQVEILQRQISPEIEWNINYEQISTKMSIQSYIAYYPRKYVHWSVK